MMKNSNQMTQEDFRRIYSAVAKKQDGKVEKGSPLAKLQGQIDKAISKGGKE